MATANSPFSSWTHWTHWNLNPVKVWIQLTQKSQTLKHPAEHCSIMQKQWQHHDLRSVNPVKSGCSWTTYFFRGSHWEDCLWERVVFAPTCATVWLALDQWLTLNLVMLHRKTQPNMKLSEIKYLYIFLCTRLTPLHVDPDIWQLEHENTTFYLLHCEMMAQRAIKLTMFAEASVAGNLAQNSLICWPDLVCGSLCFVPHFLWLVQKC